MITSEEKSSPRPTATAVLDTHGTIIGWSQEAEQLLGHPAHEVLGRPARSLLALGGASTGPRLAAEGWSGAVLLHHRDGRCLRLDVRISPLRATAARGAWLVRSVGGPGVALEIHRSVLEGLLAHAPVGMAVMDTDLRYVWLNEALARASGIPSAERLGQGLEAVFPAAVAAAAETQLRRVLETGTPLLDYEYCGPVLADRPSRPRRFSASFFRLEDSAGRVAGLCYLVVDTTERWRAQQRLRVLNDVGTSVGTTLDVVRTAQELADVAVPRLADLVTVDLLDAVVRGEVPLVDHEQSLLPLRRAGERAADSVVGHSPVGPGGLVGLAGASPSARCLVRDEPLLEALLDAGTSAWAAEVPGRAGWIRTNDFRSLMVLPVRSGGTPLGIATFLRSGSEAPFTGEDLRFAAEVVAEAGPPLEKARRFTHEQTVALTLQRNLLPRELSGGAAVEVAWRWFPADMQSGVGGDWCDVIPLSGGRVALAVGDVVGHGIHAAAAMGRFRTALRTLATMELRPDELLAHLDDLVIQLTETRSADPAGEVMAEATVGASCLYAVYDPVTHLCSVARAGHPPPVVVGPDGAVSVPDLPAGPPFGLGFMPFEHTELHLPPGSLLALYTDGLIACRRRDVDEGLSRLCSVLGRPGLTLEGLCDEAVKDLLPGPPEDDAAMLVVRARGLPAEDVAVWDLTADPSVVAEARELALGRLAEWELGHLGYATELIVSELVTNAIRYGSTPITLRLLRHDLLSCEVSDGSSTSPRMRHARTTDEGGRGLFLVSQLSARWGVRYGEQGKTIWAEQTLDSPPV